MNVLDHGFVELLEPFPKDEYVIRAARECWDSQDKANPESDERLLKRLMNLGHLSPFEFATFYFRMKLPLFVRDHIVRHRTGSYAVRSLRHCEAIPEFYMPSNSMGTDVEEGFAESMTRQLATYKFYRAQGVRAETARMLLPSAIYTTMQMKIDCRNLLNFLDQRLNMAAQYETRVYADAMKRYLEQTMPLTYRAWREK